MIRGRLLKLCLPLLAILGVAAGAWAYWTTQGAGSASATVGTLNAPTDVSVPSTASETIHVSWTGSTLGDGATPASGYYVTRVKNSDSSISNACGTSPSSSDVVDGHVMRRHGRSGRHLPLQGHGGLSHVDGNQRRQRGRHDRGDAGPLRGDGARQRDGGYGVRRHGHGKERLEATLSGYTGTIHFTSSDSGSPGLPSNYNFAAGDNGSRTFANGVTLKTSGSQTVTVNDTAQQSATGTATISVAPAAADHFRVTAPASATAGTSFNTVVLTAQDAYNNTATGYGGSHAITWSGAQTSPGGNAPSYPTSPVSFNNGVSTTTLAATLFAAGSNNLTATASSPSLTGTATISVAPAAADHFRVTAPASATAGTSFNTVVLTAQDAYNNTATGYGGSHAITWSGAQTSPGGNAPSYPTSPVSFNNGVSTTTLAATLFAAGSNNLTATASSPSLTGTATISVAPAAADHFRVTAPASATAGTSFNTVVLTAQDAYNNTATGYGGSHAITWSGAQTSPGGNAPSYPTSPVSFNNGVSTTTLAATLFAAGSNNLTATASSPSLTGTATVSVNSAGVALSYNRTCPVAVAKNSSTGFTILVPNDAYGNSFRNALGHRGRAHVEQHGQLRFRRCGNGHHHRHHHDRPRQQLVHGRRERGQQVRDPHGDCPERLHRPSVCTINAGS